MLDSKFSNLFSSLSEAEPMSYSIESCAHVYELSFLFFLTLRQIPAQEPPKAKDPILQKKLNYWPVDGDLIFKKVRAKISESDDGKNLLKIDLIIKGGQKIGILANEKKYVQAIFDLLLKNISYTQGDLLLDGIKVSELEPNLMKSKVSIISSVKN